MSHGVTMAQITEATGLLPADLADPDAWLPEAALPAIWCLLCEARPGRALSLQLAREVPYSVFGPLAYITRHAKDVRAQIDDFVRYSLVMSDHLEMERLELDDEVHLRIHHPTDRLDGGMAAEMGLALAVRFWSDDPGEPLGLMRVELVHAPNGPFDDYARAFGATVMFGRPSNAMVFHPEAMDRKPKLRDPNLYRFIQAHLDTVSAKLRAQSPLDPLAAIREAIAHNAEHSEYGAEALARRLGSSLRQLQRRVGDHGTSVRSMIEHVRLANARELARRDARGARAARPTRWSTPS